MKQQEGTDTIMLCKNRNYVVTGASSGIGYAISETIVKEGGTVFASVRKEEDAERLKLLLGDNFVPLLFDVTERKVVDSEVKKVADLVGEDGLHGLINSAGNINFRSAATHRSRAYGATL